VPTRHREVEEDRGRPLLRDPLERAAAVAGLADHLEGRIVLDPEADKVPHLRDVVDQVHRDRCHGLRAN
jgi:hypothetical protein